MYANLRKYVYIKYIIDMQISSDRTRCLVKIEFYLLDVRACTAELSCFSRVSVG